MASYQLNGNNGRSIVLNPFDSCHRHFTWPFSGPFIIGPRNFDWFIQGRSFFPNLVNQRLKVSTHPVTSPFWKKNWKIAKGGFDLWSKCHSGQMIQEPCLVGPAGWCKNEVPFQMFDLLFFCGAVQVVGKSRSKNLFEMSWRRRSIEPSTCAVALWNSEQLPTNLHQLPTTNQLTIVMLDCHISNVEKCHSEGWNGRNTLFPFIEEPSTETEAAKPSPLDSGSDEPWFPGQRLPQAWFNPTGMSRTWEVPADFCSPEI